MESNKVSRLRVNENDGPGGRTFSRKSLVILTLVLLTLIGCAGALTELWTVDAALHAVAGAVAPDGPPAAPYFPSQYVNQATENSEHIQAF